MLQQQLTAKQQELAELTRQTRQLFVELNMMSDERAAKVEMMSTATVAPDPRAPGTVSGSPQSGNRMLSGLGSQTSPLPGPPKLPKARSSAVASPKAEVNASLTPVASNGSVGTSASEQPPNSSVEALT